MIILEKKKNIFLKKSKKAIHGTVKKNWKEKIRIKNFGCSIKPFLA